MKNIKYKIQYLFLLFITFSTVLKAQPNKYLSHGNYKYLTSLNILHQITRNYCSLKNIPKFEIDVDPDKKIIAYYNTETSTILIDVEVYDLCMEFGKDSLNALSVVIGHETGHHFLHLSSKSDSINVTNAFASYPKPELLDKNINIKNVITELRSDLYGSFFSYLSGYSSFNIASKVYDKIYSYYEIDVVPAYYPSKSERKLIAQISLNDLKQYICFFDAAELLFFKGRYYEAAKIFEHLLKIFPAREIYNNTAVSYELFAISHLSDKEMPYILPVEFEPKTRLYLTQARVLDRITKMKVDSLLRRSKAMFVKAIELDSQFFPAYINLAVVNFLLQQNDLAKQNINALSKMKNVPDKINKDAKVLQAIIMALENKNDAEKYFKSAVKSNNNFDRYNMFVSQNHKIEIDTLLKNSALFYNRRLYINFDLSGFSEAVISREPKLSIKYKTEESLDGEFENKFLITGPKFNVYGITEFNSKLDNKIQNPESSNFSYTTSSGIYYFYEETNEIKFFDNKNQLQKIIRYYITK